MHLSAMGGIETWQDALEFILLGGGSIQITTAVMQYGYRIIDNLKSGLNLYLAEKGFRSVKEAVGLGLDSVSGSTDGLERDTVIFPQFVKEKCIGCGRCWKVCPRGAISYTPEEKNLDEILPKLIKKGIDCLEFHVIGQDENEIFTKWKYINDNFDGMLSICISRGKLGDEALIERIKK